MKQRLPLPKLIVGLRMLTDDELCIIIGAILARPGDSFTEQELDELAAINAEFQRRGQSQWHKTISN